MRDYKKIYDELFYFQVGVDGEELAQELCMDTLEYTSALLNGKTGDKQKERKFFDFINTLRQDTPTQDIVNIFEYINKSADYQYTDMGEDWIFQGYNIPDEQIEAVCKKYAYLEWWARTIDLIPYYKSDVFYLEITLKIPDNFIKNTIQLFDYYHKTIIPRKALSELSNTPNQEQEPQPTNPILPPELSTPEAMKYWKKAQEAGLVDEHYKFLKSITQRADFADMFSEKLGIEYKWKYFEKLWNCKNMATDLSKFQTQKGYINKHNKIKKIFE